MSRIGVAGRVRSSGPASARSFSTSRFNLVLTRGLLFFPPVYRDGVHLYCQPLSGSPELILSVWQLRTNGVHCLEYTGTGPVVLAVACLRNMGCLFWYLHGPNSYFLTPTIIGTMNWPLGRWVAQKRLDLLQSTRPRPLNTIFRERCNTRRTFVGTFSAYKQSSMDCRVG